jgi:hypothetical protein
MGLPCGWCLLTTQGCVQGFNPVRQFHSVVDALRVWRVRIGHRCAKTSKEELTCIDSGLGCR